MRAYFLMVFVVSAMVVAAGAVAQTPTTNAPESASAKPAGSAVPLRFDPRGKSPYSPKLMKGHAAYGARDFPGAIAAYKEAIKDDAADPYGHYFLGEAQLAAGNIAEADASFAAGLRVVTTRDDLHAKLLFVIADLRERQGKWVEAKRAWDDYAQFSTTHPNVKGFAATASERNRVIDVRIDLEAKNAPVKQRIEQRIKETTGPAPDEAPQAPSKKK